MFARTFDHPFEVVIISSDGSPIQCAQQSSSHELRVSVKSRVTVLIQQPPIRTNRCSNSPDHSINGVTRPEFPIHSASEAHHSIAPTSPIADQRKSCPSGICSPVHETDTQVTSFNQESSGAAIEFNDSVIGDSVCAQDSNLSNCGTTLDEFANPLLEPNSSTSNTERSEFMSLSLRDPNQLSCPCANNKKRRDDQQLAESLDTDEYRYNKQRRVDAVSLPQFKPFPGAPQTQDPTTFRPTSSDEIPPPHVLEEVTIETTIRDRARLSRLEEQEERFNQLRSSDSNRERLVLDYDRDGRVRVEVARVFVNLLKPYQVTGIKFLYNMTIENMDRLEEGDAGSGCILAHSMGSGKTFPVFIFVHTILTSPGTSQYTKSILISVPSNRLKVWKLVFEDWSKESSQKFRIYEAIDSDPFAVTLDVLDDWHKNGGALIIDHDTFGGLSSLYRAQIEMQIDPDRTCNPLTCPDMIIIDEGENHKTFADELGKGFEMVTTKRKIVLTGAALQTNPDSYFSMFSFIQPSLLGSKEDFENHFRIPIECTRKTYSSADKLRQGKGREFVLHKLLSNYILWVGAKALRRHHQPKVEFGLIIRPSRICKTMYDYFLDHCSKEDGHLEHVNYLQLLVNHPGVYHLETGVDQNEAIDHTSLKRGWYKQFVGVEELLTWRLSNKIEMMLRIMKECRAAGDKLVVASQSFETLSLIENLLIANDWVFGMNYFRVDSLDQSAEKKVLKQMNAFNDPANENARLFLLRIRAEIVGIHLTGANRLIFFDVSLNPSDDMDVLALVNRSWQTKRIYVYRFVTKDTMEEMVFRKRILSRGMTFKVNDIQQFKRIFSPHELAAFYDTRPQETYPDASFSTPDDTLMARILTRSGNKYLLECIELDSTSEVEPGHGLTEEEQEIAWTKYLQERYRSQYR